MENPITEDSYEKIKRETSAFYFRIGRVWCPVVGEFIYFNKVGFHHLIQKGKRFRPRNEQKRRFLLLSHVKEILSDPKTHCDDRHDQNDPRVRYWNLSANKENKSIKIILIQIKNGKKYFF